ncbi:iduronate 2-sulfatase-like [Dreissena polymorpha]|uniref:iduronate 2-sulfatase-like n=1 Tax=Dreissena polymorpha TaxID=45954 RepID=UPI0022654E1D|nr:iduronate 2-sulfatase-like [Dreissena polymorpha]
MGKIFHSPNVSGHDDPISWSLPYHRENPGKLEGHERSWKFVPDNDTIADPLQDMRIAKDAITTLGYFAKGGKYQNQPFFLAVGFIRPHLPFISPISYSKHYPQESVILPQNPLPPVHMPPVAWTNINELSQYDDMVALQASGAINSSLPDNTTLDLRKAYYSAVSYLDAMVGSVLDELKRLNLDNNTIVSLIGDHGYHLGEHGLWCKFTNFELATHAPMIIRIPGLTDQGIVTESLVEMVDLFPTLVEASGLPKLPVCPPNSKSVRTCTEGESLMPLVSNPSMKWKNAAFSQYPRTQSKTNIMGYTIRTDEHRYTEWPEFSYTTHTPDWTRLHGKELYDHTIDPDENVNRSADPLYANITRILKARLHAGWRDSSPSINPSVIVDDGRTSKTQVMEPKRITPLTTLQTENVPTSIMEGTPRRGRLFHLKQEECKSTENTPNGSIRHVDASFKCEDKISPMLAKLRMTPDLT